MFRLSLTPPYFLSLRIGAEFPTILPIWGGGTSCRDPDPGTPEIWAFDELLEAHDDAEVNEERDRRGDLLINRPILGLGLSSATLGYLLSQASKTSLSLYTAYLGR